MKESNLINNSNQKENNNGIEIKPIKEKKTIHGEFFVAFASILLFYVGYIFLFQQMTPFQFSTLIIDIFFICIYLMMFWAYIIVMKTPPGSIPLYWGFYIGDDDEKRKRYCLICNAFKPERSKHCSICNECILNMDHHCPWVNNCIGFFNRKFFMQFIFYVEISFIYNFILSFIYLIKKLKYVKDDKMAYLYYGFLLINCLAVGIAAFLFGKFVIYHIKLVLKNSSTIENLDKENQDKYAKFCLSSKENFQQVFGKNQMYWFLPINTEEGKPEGDGLLWKVNNNEQNV
jgi:palmitoyltransferase